MSKGNCKTPKVGMVNLKRKLPLAALCSATKRKLEGSIPENIRVSIQLLLLNFHSQNPIPINCVPAEYESIFHKKLELYGYEDVDSMLRSQEMRANVGILRHKQIPSLVGLPLPRSANIVSDGKSWTIDLNGPNQVIEEIDESPLKIKCSTARKELQLAIVDRVTTPVSDVGENKSVQSVMSLKVLKPPAPPVISATVTSTEALNSCSQPQSLPIAIQKDVMAPTSTPDVNTTKQLGELIMNTDQTKNVSPNLIETPVVEDQTTFFRRADVPSSWYRPLEADNETILDPRSNGLNKDVFSRWKETQPEPKRHLFTSLHPPPPSTGVPNIVIGTSSNMAEHGKDNKHVDYQQGRNTRNQEHTVHPFELYSGISSTPLTNDPKRITINPLVQLSTVDKTSQAIPTVAGSERMNQSGVWRNIWEHERSTDSNIQPNPCESSLIPVEFTNFSDKLMLQDLLKGRTLMKKNSIGLITSDSNYSELYISSSVMNLFQQKMNFVMKKIEIETFEHAQNLLCSSQKQKFPFSCCFVHYSALKLAEIDYEYGFQFTSPTTPDGESLVKPDEVLFFCDLAGGPGGNVEYILWKKNSAAKGWGMTRTDRDHEYCLNESQLICPEYFEAYYGNSNSIRNGSFLDTSTVRGFIDLVMKGTDSQGVHVVTTMGSYNNLGNSKDNENVWKPILLTQIYIALKVLRRGGNLVLKLFDVKTNYSASLVYFLYRTFEKIEFARPFTAVPGSSERIIICLTRKCEEEIGGVIAYLENCHQLMCDWKSSAYKGDKHKKFDVLVPDSKLASCGRFLKQLKEVNDTHKQIQIDEITDIINCRGLDTPKFEELRKARVSKFGVMMYQKWNLPKKFWKDSSLQVQSQESLMRSIGAQNPEVLDFQSRIVEFSVAVRRLRKTAIWNFVPLSDVTGTCGIFIGTGGRYIYHLGNQGNLVEVKTLSTTAKFVLSKGTVVVGEIVQIRNYNRCHDKAKDINVFYIIDGMMLGGRDIRNLPYAARKLECQKYAKAVTQFDKPNYAEVKVRNSYCLSEIGSFLRNLEDPLELMSKEESSGKFPLQMNVGHPQGFSNTKSMMEVTGVLFFETGSRPDFRENFLNTLLQTVVWKWNRVELLERLNTCSDIENSFMRRFLS